MARRALRRAHAAMHGPEPEPHPVGTAERALCNNGMFVAAFAHPTRRYFFAWLKYFKSGAGWSFFDGISNPSTAQTSWGNSGIFNRGGGVAVAGFLMRANFTAANQVIADQSLMRTTAVGVQDSILIGVNTAADTLSIASNALKWGESSGVIFNSILERTPVSAVRLNPDLPPKLEEIILALHYLCTD